MKEVWKDIPGYRGDYQASNLGRVRSLKKGKIVIRRQQTTLKGRLRLNLCLDGVMENRLVHQLVLEAFVGPCPDGWWECCHADDNPKNNQLDNLTWGTRSSNIQQMWDRNRRPRQEVA